MDQFQVTIGSVAEEEVDVFVKLDAYPTQRFVVVKLALGAPLTTAVCVMVFGHPALEVTVSVTE